MIIDPLNPKCSEKRDFPSVKLCLTGSKGSRFNPTHRDPVLALLWCSLVLMLCLSDGTRLRRLIFQESQMPAWPGSVFSTLIMQSVSEEAGEHGFDTVKASRLGSSEGWALS